MKDYLEALLAEVEEEEEEQTEQEAAFPLEEHLWWKKAAGMEERKAREEQVTPAPADMLGHRAAQEQAYPAAGETESGEREPPDLTPPLPEEHRRPTGRAARFQRNVRKGGEAWDMIQTAGYPAVEVLSGPQKSGKTEESVWRALRRARAAADYARREHSGGAHDSLPAPEGRTQSLGAAELDRLFQRDARRYDGDSPLY